MSQDILTRLRAYKSESWGSALKDVHEAAVEIERLRAVAQHETDCAEAYKAHADTLRADIDCRTCRNYSFFDACLSVIKCVDGAAYQRGGWSVRLWEAA